MLGERAPIEHYDVAKWMRTLHVNANVPFVLTQRCMPLLRKSSDPSIVFTSSGVVPRPRAYWGAYLVSKWASDGLMHMLADEFEVAACNASEQRQSRQGAHEHALAGVSGRRSQCACRARESSSGRICIYSAPTVAASPARSSIVSNGAVRCVARCDAC